MARIGSRGAMRSWAIVGMIVVALHLTGPTSTRAELTSNQLLDGLPKVSGSGAVGFALEMQALGMTWANADLIARHQAPIFCLPPQPGLTQQKLNVPRGKYTDFRRTVDAKDSEKIVFTWQVWPDKATLESAEAKMHEDKRLEVSN